MRDPSRIDVVLDLIRRYWMLNPDLRLSQLIVNMVRPSDPCPQVFSHEDDRLIASLRDALRKIEGATE